jgi:predicted ATP-grasp superfamily ATP-dependent carboligase
MTDALERLAVGVVGASARAAVGSLLRAGFAAWAADLFTDRDLKRTAPCARCPADDYPDALPRLADTFPPGPVIYTGGLENRPDVVRDLAARRPLWGNPPAVLEAVRDPFRLLDILHGKAFAYPRVRPADGTLPAGRWLRKPRRSAAGLGIRPAGPQDRPSTSHYLQEYVAGPAMSAVFASTATRCVLLGVTEQLVGEPWLHAPPFRYAGNIGPLAIGWDLSSELTLLGYRLVIATGIRGVWGADFISHDGRAWVVEVNPRYTASVEVLELGGRVAAFGDPTPDPSPEKRGESTPPSLPGKGAGGLGPPHVGKAIYFAPRPVVFPASGPWDADLAGEFHPWRRPAFADIPEPGEVVEVGSPVLTFFAEGSTADECRSRLQSTAADLDHLFGAESSP